MGSLVNAKAFNNTFDTPGSTILALIVSIMEVGAFLGSVASSLFGERLGRTKTLALATVIMMVGSLLMATAYTRAHMIVARVVAGVGLGMSNSTAPVLQSEYSPKANRGLCEFLPPWIECH
jgi:MFS family permease